MTFLRPLRAIATTSPPSIPRVCHVVASTNQQTGGTALSVTSLAQALADRQIQPHLLTLNYPHLGEAIVPERVQFHTYPAHFWARQFRGFHPQAAQALHQLAPDLDLIHNHGLWMFPNWYARQAAIAHQLPFIISPRGMLETWSLKRSRIKKGLAWLLYEQKNLKLATVFHATSIAEAHSIRQLGLAQPIALLPNGVHLPDLDRLPPRETLIQTFPELAGKRWLLCLSRIHPKKGLDSLLYIWHSLATRFPDWHLILAGSDLIGYQAKLQLLTANLGLGDRVTFAGMLTGQSKIAALGNADLFILPTHSENFGIAIAESLSYAVPVITTQGTPWQELQTHHCGWWVQNDRPTLTHTLTEAMNLTEQQRRTVGLNGRHLVATRYDWNAIAQEMAAVYRWILGGIDRPACIVQEDRL